MIVHVALEGVMEGALGLGVDVVDTAARLARAGRGAAPPRARALAQRVVSWDGAPVPSVQRRAIAVDGALRLGALRRGDVIVLPGVFATNDASVERVLARPDVVAVVRTLKRAAARGVLVAASCSATFLLGAAGVLDARRATTTWWLLPSFSKRFPRVELRADKMVVDADVALTAGSAFAHADLMLAVVARIAGPSLASLAARYLVLDARASQSRYMVLEHLRSADPVLARVEKHVAAHLDRQITLAELARAAGTSPRTLARRIEAAVGTSPLGFVQRLRVSQAAHLLDTSGASVDEVAARVGYADTTAFRRVFKRHMGETPRGRRAATRSP